jgi:hypothetical protein
MYLAFFEGLHYGTPQTLNLLNLNSTMSHHQHHHHPLCKFEIVNQMSSAFFGADFLSCQSKVSTNQDANVLLDYNDMKMKASFCHLVNLG